MSALAIDAAEISAATLPFMLSQCENPPLNTHFVNVRFLADSLTSKLLHWRNFTKFV
jgi:hypothetical protein